MRTNRFASVTAMCFAIFSALLLSLPANASGNRKVIVLFTGFSGSSNGENDGLIGFNNNKLVQSFGNDPNFPLSSKVFSYSDQLGAFNFIQSFSDINHLFVIGHLLGGDAVIELATDYLSKTTQMIDLSVQIDSVGLFDDIIPKDIIKRSLNYYQISEGLFEPQGEIYIEGATNINAETFCKDPAITHTSIDDNNCVQNDIVKEIKITQSVPGPLPLLGLCAVFGYSRKLRKLNQVLKPELIRTAAV